MTILLVLLTTHFVADFMLQSDWMAIHKSFNNRALLLHTSIYSAMFLAAGWRFAVITFVLHTAQDWLTSRWTSALWKRNERHDFFVVIGFDQLLHAYGLAATWWFLTS